MMYLFNGYTYPCNGYVPSYYRNTFSPYENSFSPYTYPFYAYAFSPCTPVPFAPGERFSAYEAPFSPYSFLEENSFYDENDFFFEPSFEDFPLTEEPFEEFPEEQEAENRSDKLLKPYLPKKMARARIKGGPLAPKLSGIVYFKEVPGGTQVSVEVTGLPPYEPAKDGKAPIGPHGFHVHEFGNCTVGNPNDPFQAAGGHWNPTNDPHGHHAGDFPVLFSNDGIARMTFFTNRFKPKDIIGKSVIIHQNPDDYRSQPAGDAGKRLACGVIQ